MWDIYSIGDAAYLTAVLNAVAMLSGSGNMHTLAGVGFLVGFLLIMFQGIIQARPPQLQHMLVAWVVYMGMFGPTVKVAVQDVYSGAVRVVDNVPLGPAAIGGLMSGIGYGATKLFEQAFSTPTMTGYGFAAPLHILQGVRKTTLSMTALGAANAPTAGADMARTFVNYLSECTLYGFNNGTRSADDLLRNPNWRTALGSTLVVPTTELWIGGNPVTKECPDAWTDLSNYLTTQYVPKLQASVAATLRIANPNDVPGAVNSALDALAGTGVGAQNYMVMATAAAMLPYARSANKRALLQAADAAAIEQASQQRNTQWASEERLFSRIVRPMMTFFEAFLYAVSPLMVFAIGLGPTGISMVGKYLLFGLWIQLWQPILAIINLYIIMAVKFKMDALQDVALGNTPMPSILAIWKLDFILSDYLGVGGMLAASTPAISLMLIYGSAITATHLAGRLQGGDHINEKMASPDAVNPAAALNMQPIMNHGPLSGTVAPGAEQQSWSVNVGHEVQRDLRSSQQAMQRSSSGFSSALGSAASATASKSGESFDSHASTWMKDGGKSQTDSVLMATAEGLTQQYSESGMSSNQMAAVIAGSLGASKGKGDIAAKLSSQYGVDSKLADTMASDISEKVTSDQALQARVAEGLRVDSQTGERNVFTAGLDSRESSQLTQSAEDVLSSSRSLDHAESQSERFGTMGSFNGIAAGAGLVRPEHQGLNEKLDRTIANYNLDGDRDDAAQRLLVGGVTADPDQARAIAGMGLLLGHTDGQRARGMTAPERAGAKEAGMEILASEFNFQAPQGISPDRNTDLSGSAPGFGGAQSQVEGAGLRDIRPETAGVPGQVSEHGDATHQAWNPGAVDRFVQGARTEVAASAGQAQGALRSEKQSRLGAIIEQHAALPRSAAQMAQNEAGGLLAQAAESVALAGAGVGGVASQTAAGAQAFAGALRDGQGISAAVQAGRAAAGSEAGWTATRDAMVDARMNQISSYGLSPAQEQLYRTSTETVIAGMPSEAQQAAHQAVITESGSNRRGEQIADLIERSASTKDDTDLRLIGAYNEQLQPPEKKSPESGLRSQSRGGTGGDQRQGPGVALSSPVANPSQYPVTSGFSEHRVHPVSGRVRPHRGVDLAMPEGTPIHAAADGIARTGVQERGAGNYIAVDHDGNAGTRYMHLSRVAVQDGQAVQRGDVIGYSGDTGGGTGPHLHFEVWRNGEAVDPMRDPLTQLHGPGHLGHEAPGVTAAPPRPASGGDGAGHHQAPIVAPAPLRGMFAETEARHHLPPGMLTALASVESHFNPTAVSDAGAKGMFQITPATAADYHVSNPFDPREAAEGAATKLATDYRKFGNWEHAVLAYNAGTERIDDYLAGRGKPLKQETVDYLPKVLYAFQQVDRDA